MDRKKAERYLKIGLLGAVLTLIGDLLIGAAKFPDGVGLFDGYFAIALNMPAWRPILGGLIGVAGICLEFGALMTLCPLIRAEMPHPGRFYKLAVQFIAFARGRTPFPRWYCVFNLMIGKGVFNAVRYLGDTALINGIGTSNMSLGAIVMFTALLLGWRKYVGEREYTL